MQRKGLIILLLLLFPILTFAQGNMVVKGKVTDNTGEPLIGANVRIQKLNLGAATNMEGVYQFEIPRTMLDRSEVELVASFMGYKPKSAKFVLGGGTFEQNFFLLEDFFQSEEVVVTGAASKTSKSIAEVAVARISASDLTGINAFSGISQLVAGKVAGVQMTTASGNVGGGFRFNVRGGGGLSGSGQPTIYIDGVRVENTEVGIATGGQLNNTLSGINSNDIEKVEFLKGPAAAAMYGTSGANGVVLITTKSGQAGRAIKKGLSFEYRFNSGFNEKHFDYQHENFQTDSVANAIFKRGYIREHFFSFTGGNPDLRYYGSIENRNEEGILSTNVQDRTTARLNVSSVPYSNLTLRLNAYYVKNNVKRPNNDNSIFGFLGNVLLAPTPFGWTKEPMLHKAISDAHTNQFIGSVGASYQPFANFDINATLGIDNSDLREERSYPVGFNGLVPKGEKSLWQRNNTNLNMDFNASYSYEFSDIKIKSIIGAQAFDRRLRSFFVTGQDFNSTLISDIGSAGKISSYSEGFAHRREAGLFTEHSFNYVDQYFLTLGIRKDYATAIGKNAPSITYPKASFAVRLDKFDFLPTFVDLFKLRAAYGEGGNLPGSLDGIPFLWTAAAGPYGAGAIISRGGNDSIEPERVKEFEVGFELELVNAVSLEFSYFNTKAIGSLVASPIARSYGSVTSLPFNVGAVKSSGFEALLRYDPIKTPEYDLSFTLIWNYQQNEVTDLGGNPPLYSSPNTVQVGMARSQFFAIKTEDVVYKTDGTYSAAKPTATRVDLGNPVPDHSGSFAVNFRFLTNFNLYALGEFGMNNKMFNNTALFANRFGNGQTYNELAAKLGIINKAGITKLTPGTDEFKAAALAYAKLDWRYEGNYIEDADYFTIREVSLSYDFSDILKDVLAFDLVKSLTAGISATNIKTFTKYSGGDVGLNFGGAQQSIQRGQDFLTMPTPRTVNFWLRAGF